MPRIFDKIDLRLSEIYRFSREEINFLLNYDIKYRMGLNGKEADADD